MLGATQDNLSGFEHLANGFVRGPDTRLFRHIVGETLQGPHRIGLVQAARSAPHSGQHLLFLLLRDFRWRSWHGPIFESLDAFGHPATRPSCAPFDLLPARSWQSPEPSCALLRPVARFERGSAVSHLLSFDTASLTLPTLLLSGVVSPAA